MSPGGHTEAAFEEAVEFQLLRREWARGPRLYDAELGLDTAEMWEFVSKTQIKRFEQASRAARRGSGCRDAVVRDPGR